MNAAKRVFYFDDPIEYLNAQFQERQKANPRFSLRAWARQMGYQNPSLLFQVLRGERRLKMDLALKIAGTLQLKGKALRYFEIMVLKRACQSEAERRVFDNMLTKLRPKKLRAINNFSLDVFSADSEWYHWAILTMTELDDFQAEPAWIQKRLGADVDKKTIKRAFERLLRLGLLIKQDDGTYKKADTDNPMLMPNNIPIEAVRQYHSQMIEKAKAAIEQQSMKERRLRGTTVAFRESDLPLVEHIIAEAHRQIMELSASSVGEDVYQLNSQFFRLTSKKKDPATKVRNAILAAMLVQFNMSGSEKAQAQTGGETGSVSGKADHAIVQVLNGRAPFDFLLTNKYPHLVFPERSVDLLKYDGKENFWQKRLKKKKVPGDGVKPLLQLVRKTGKRNKILDPMQILMLRSRLILKPKHRKSRIEKFL